MRQYNIKLDAVLAIIVMTFSFMGAYDIFYGEVKSLQWYFFYYGRFIFMLFFVLYSYISDVRYKDANTRKWLCKLLLTPVILMFTYSCLIWMVQRTPFPYISRGTSDTLFMIGSYLAGISLVPILKEKTIKYGLIAAIITFAISCILGVLNCGFDFFIAIFGQNIDYKYYLIHIRYLELHEILYTIGLYLICLIFTYNENENKKQTGIFLIAMICFILGGKRIGFLALVLALILGTFLKRICISNKVKILSIVGTVGIILSIIYVSISTSTKLVSILSEYGIDMMGRDIIYQYFRQFCEFSPTFIGKGVGFVTRQFDYTTSADLYNMASTRALHNDYMKVFIEIGFFGFILWAWYWLKHIPKVLEKKVGINARVICFLLITYAFVTYLTDNTVSYFNFQLHLAMIISSIACGYIKYKYDEDKVSEIENMGRELTLQETQSVSLEILKAIADICEQQNLRYTLIYGTLIGAIRHKGYIPWDDDIDIMMPRPDYDKLLAYLKENIQNYPNLRVFNPDECKEYPYMITRISDQRYVIKMENEKPFGMGVFIDIYPYDGLGITKDEAIAYGMKGDRLSSLCYQATRDHFAIETTTSPLRKLIKYPVYLFAKICGKDFFQNKLKSLVGVKDYDISEYVGCVVWLSGGEKDIFLRKWFDETIMLPFGKYEFRVPKYYDEVLRHGYGDYMELPSEENRIGHHFYKVYEK